MFPHRPVPELPDDAYLKDPNRKTDPADETFVSRNSGKIGLFSFALAVGLIYSYFKGNFNEKDMENVISNSQAIEAMEVNEVRFTSIGVTQEIYESLVKKSQIRFPSGYATYASFIEFVKKEFEQEKGRQKKEISLGSCHLIDRIVIKHLAKSHTSIQSNDGINEIAPASISSDVNPTSQLLPVSFLLSVLNMGVQSSAAQRASSLFDVAKMIDSSDQGGLLPNALTEEKSNTVSIAAAVGIVEHLGDSCQLPCEKQVIVNSQHPIRLYRKKEALEMVGYLFSLFTFLLQFSHVHASLQVNSYIDAEKRVDAKWLTRDEFVALILSKQVCAWAECYRRKPE